MKGFFCGLLVLALGSGPEAGAQASESASTSATPRAPAPGGSADTLSQIAAPAPGLARPAGASGLVAGPGSGSGSTAALGSDFAVGLIVGAPTGLSVRQDLDPASALQAALWLDLNEKSVGVQADYIVRLLSLFPLDPKYGKVHPYYGGGVRLDLGNRDTGFAGPFDEADEGGLSLRLPVGARYDMPYLPFEFFAEVSPLLHLLPETVVDAGLALGLRFQVR